MAINYKSIYENQKNEARNSDFFRKHNVQSSRSKNGAFDLVHESGRVNFTLSVSGGQIINNGSLIVTDYTGSSNDDLKIAVYVAGLR